MVVGFVSVGGGVRLRSVRSSVRKSVAGGLVPSRASVRCRRVRMEVEPESGTKVEVEMKDGEERGAPMVTENAGKLAKENVVEHTSGEAYRDLLACLFIYGSFPAMFAFLEADVLASQRDLVLSILFVLGYSSIILEDFFQINKSAASLIMATFLWTMLGAVGDTHVVLSELGEKLSEVSEILFFLMGAMTIVEIVDSHEGFNIVSEYINTNSRRPLMWIVGFVTFFMSSVLDNLTSTIVMVSLLRKLVKDPETRKLFGGVIVIAANAGGAWTPIGDVTTTMLWINGNISALATMKDLFLPSLISLIVSLGVLSPSVYGEVEPKDVSTSTVIAEPNAITRRNIVFWGGVGALIGVPIFKATTGLPPYLGMICGLGMLWIVTDYINRDSDEETSEYRLAESALRRIDTSSVLFFLGILLSVGALENAGLLQKLAETLNAVLPNLDFVAVAIGLFSAIIDNVPLVAATMGMYDTATYPLDSQIWQLIAFCAGTGGSILVIGSAAGVALMGMEKTDFLWYTKKISFAAAAGFFAGVGIYVAASSTPIMNLVSQLTG